MKGRFHLWAFFDGASVTGSCLLAEGCSRQEGAGKRVQGKGEVPWCKAKACVRA